MASGKPVSSPKPGEISTGNISRSSVWVVVIVITTAAAVLRLYKLGVWSFWVDEIFTLQDSTTGGALGQFHGGTYPLSYMLIGASMAHFGINEWSARIVPALFGIVTPATVYLLSRKHFGEGTSIIAAIIIAISPWHLYWSQMARFYTMTVFFATASLLVLHKGLEENRRIHIIVAGLLMALGVLSHYSALLMLAGIGVYAALIILLRWEKPAGLNWANILIYLAPLIVGAIIVGPKAVALLSKYINGHPTGTTFTNPIKGATYVVVSTAYRVEPAITLLALVGACIGLLRRARGIMLLTCAVLIPLALMTVAGAMTHAENRYAFIILPAAALLAGDVIVLAFQAVRIKNRAVAMALPVALFLPMLQHDVSYFGPVFNGERWNYRTAADYIRDHAHDGDIVYSPMPFPMAYYLRNTSVVVRDLNPEAGLPGPGSWIVMEDATRGNSVSNQLASWLEDDCSYQAHFSAASPVADYGLTIYRKIGQQQAAR